MGILYGDSTPFEHGEGFIELLRAAVDLGVALMRAQDAALSSEQEAQALRAQVQADGSALGTLQAALEQAVAPFVSNRSARVAKTASAVREASHGTILAELAELERKDRRGETGVQAGAQAARENVAKALSSFMQHHDLPQTAVGLRLSASEGGYSGEALVAAPVGLEAVFALSLPAESPWGRSRRVGELVELYALSLPREVGLIAKRTESVETRMEKLLVDEVECSATRVRVTMRKAARAEPGFRIDISWGEGATHASVQVVGEGGAAACPPQALSGEDLAATLRLRDEIVHSTEGLASRRRAMSGARFDGKPLRDLAEPQVLAQRVIGALAPIVREIELRSGAPGELVLRRDLGQGHRDEIYVTKAELHEKVLALSPPLRAVFEPLGLGEGPRSPRDTISVGGT